MKVFRTRAIINYVRKKVNKVSANGTRSDEKGSVRSEFALLVRPRFSRVDFSARLRPWCVPCSYVSYVSVR